MVFLLSLQNLLLSQKDVQHFLNSDEAKELFPERVPRKISGRMLLPWPYCYSVNAEHPFGESTMMKFIQNLVKVCRSLRKANFGQNSVRIGV